MNIKYLAIALAGLTMTACGYLSRSSQSDSDSDTTAVSESQPLADTEIIEEATAEEATANESATQADIDMLKQFYTECVFGAGSPEKYCTQKCLKKLAAENEYDDGGYAVWNFRTDAQDGDGPSMVTDVQFDVDGWYTVSFVDMGNKGTTKVLVADGKIDDYRRVR